MSMTEILPPEILTAAGSAWDKAHERQETASQGFGSVALFGALDGAVSEAMERGGVGFDLDGVTNPEIRELFKRDLEGYRTVFAGAGIDMPTPAELAQGGIDFGYLAELKEELPDHDLVVAPLTLPLDSVRKLVSAVVNDTSIRDNPINRSVESMQTKWRSDGLYVGESPSCNWDGIMTELEYDWGLPITNHKGINWTAFLLLNSDESDSLIPYEQAAQQDMPIVPPTGYISYQLYRIRQGMMPVDSKQMGVISSKFTDPEGSTRVLTSFYDGHEHEIKVEFRLIVIVNMHSAKVRPLVG